MGNGVVHQDSQGQEVLVLIENGRTGKEYDKMPRGDGTGPAGMGPMTGRAAGYCAGYPMPGYMNPIAGRWYGARGAVPAYGGVASG